MSPSRPPLRIGDLHVVKLSARKAHDEVGKVKERGVNCFREGYRGPLSAAEEGESREVKGSQAHRLVESHSDRAFVEIQPEGSDERSGGVSAHNTRLQSAVFKHCACGEVRHQGGGQDGESEVEGRHQVRMLKG
jgi:hypothetical protein